MHLLLRNSPPACCGDSKSKANGLFLSLLSGVIYIFVIYQSFAGRISLGDVTFYMSALTNVQGALSDLILVMANINESSLFFSNYTKLLAIPQSIEVPSQPCNLSPLTQGIEFRKVSFRYNETKPWVVKNISFFLPAGQCLALVGLNGAGKTTLIKLLVRFYDPTEGQILWDGVDIREFDPKILRQHMGAIFQDFNHYELSAFENIALGDIEGLKGSDLMDQKVKKAARKVGIHKTIDALPQGYQTLLSRWLAKDHQGMDLSGGEWQKIGLARMLVREADLLILDEPTAALDAQAEYDIYNHFVDLVSRKTSILISHRFGTVRMANVIAVLQDGGIIEYGSHEKLLALNGKYAQLFNMQAERYH